MQRIVHTRDEQGQAMTEFAVVLPVLALILFAIIQFGIAFNNYLTLTDAVRRGARTAAVSRQTGAGSSAAVAAVTASATDLQTAKLAVTVSSTWQAGEDVTVTATYPYSISLFGLVVKSGSLKSSTTERVE
jgi:Flp pilus assembly protein TadG